MRPQQIFEFTQFDVSKPIHGLDEIRRINPQRHEFEQLTAIVHIDQENHSLIGYKDVTEEEFWIAGHMPGFPLMPGVMQIECAAQLAGFYARKFNVVGGDYLGFGGLEQVRFRRPVFPGCRLVVMARLINKRGRSRAEFEFQGYVEEKLTFNGTLIGMAIERDRKID